MPIFKIVDDQITPIARTSFEQQGLKERIDLQTMLKTNISVISPNTLVVAEEFSDWEDSRRRIDLLGIDKDANLVVIELKRTEDGGHMELQAIRYAAMISTLTFERLVQIFEQYLDDNNITIDAENTLLEFLEWNEPDEENFGQEVKIVLASAEFSKELTTSVLWLNDLGLDIRCVRMHPYKSGDEVLLDIQTVLPIPETAEYQVRIREKKQREREARASSRDVRKFDLSVAGNQFEALNKRWMVFQLVSSVLQNGGSPNELIDALPKGKSRLFLIFDGVLNERQVYEKIMEEDTGGRVPRAKRYFINDGEVFHFEGRTYILSNQWGKKTQEFIENVSVKFPNLQISIEPSA